MKDLQIEANHTQIKLDDTGTLIPFYFFEDENKQKILDDEKAVFNIKNEQGLVKQLDAVVIQSGYSPCINSIDLIELPVGTYQVELWVNDSNDLVKIYPDNGYCEFSINENATLTKGSIVPTTTLSDFENQLKGFISDKLETVKGQDGKNGLNGKDGITPTINIQATNTLDAGSNATVTNNGTDTDVQLVFGIPKGQDGTNGISPTVQIGNVSTLASGSNATVTNSGNNTNLILNFGIPKGADGTNGTNGQDATINRVTVSDSTDLNTLTTDGLYEVQGVSVQNAPTNESGSWSILQVYSMNSGSNGYQILSDTNQDVIFYRTWNNNNSFCNWIALTSPWNTTPAIACAGWQLVSNYTSNNFYNTVINGKKIWLANLSFSNIYAHQGTCPVIQAPSDFPDWIDFTVACRWNGTATLVKNNSDNCLDINVDHKIPASTECHCNIMYIG